MLNQRVKVSSSTYLAPPIVNAVQNDSGRVLICEPFDYTITGSETATLICRRPDGTIFTYTGTVNAADNDVTVPLAAEGGALTQVGDVDAELILTASGSTVTTFKITLRVQEDISGEATPEEKTFVQQLVADVDAAFAQYQAALAAVEAALDNLVPKTTNVNGKALSGDISLNPSDLGAVPETRKVNNKALNQNITLNAGDVGAVPTTRTVNGKALSSNVTIEAGDVPFTPTGSLSATKVQTAIEEVRDMVEVGHETVLYTSSDTAIAAGTYLLDDSVANYQYLDIYTSFSGYNEIRRIPVDEGQSYSLRFLNLADSDSSTFVGWSEISLSFSGAVMTVNHNKYVNWAGKVNSDAVVASSGKPYIIKILGIKYDALGSGGGGGTSNYNDLSNKPSIGGVTLSGDKSLSDLGAVAASQGAGNAGKFLGIDNTGAVVAMSLPVYNGGVS